MGLNEDLFLALNGARNPLIDPVMVAFAVVGLFPLTFLWALPLWFHGRRMDAFDFVVVLALAEVSALVLKLALAVPRPEGIGAVLEAPFDDRDDPAFPSGHTTRAFVAACFVALRLRDRRWTALLLTYASIMGFSRVYVGAHWPSDVLGGVALGLAWAVGFDRLAERDAWRHVRDSALRILSRGTGHRA